MKRKLLKATSCALACAAAAVVLSTATAARADEGGVGVWLPGQYGSLIATPQSPGLAFGMIALHNSVEGGGDVAAARQIIVGGIPRDIDVSLNASLDGDVDLIFLSPSYTFAQPILGGQLTIGAGIGVGHSDISIDGDLIVRLANGTIITRSGSTNDERGGATDLFPSAQLRWNRGVHNYMAYVMGDIPIGTYDADRLANIGLGHGAIDAGGAYTYFNPQTGWEFSATSGLTFNFENEDTDYQNGIDWHLDWAGSRFLSPTMHVGLAGYIYQQITEDDGAPRVLGDFESSVMGIGPQIGFIVAMPQEHQAYINLKGFHDFNAENRPEGWSVWLTLAVSPAAPHH